MIFNFTAGVKVFAIRFTKSLHGLLKQDAAINIGTKALKLRTSMQLALRPFQAHKTEDVNGHCRWRVDSSVEVAPSFEHHVQR
jgi:hypothetical protein